MDRLMIWWAVWLICSGAFHDSGVALWRFGDAYTYLGTYFLFRVFLHDLEDIRNLLKMACLVMLPLAAGMLMEKMSGTNYMAALFGESSDVSFRNGHYRARGPYSNAILAGTAGAIWLPLAFHYWRENRTIALLGIAATGTIVLCSGASGPFMTAFAGLAAMALWRYRFHLSMIRRVALGVAVILNFVMSRPVYFLVARIDIGGGSTGWYRAILIQGALEHLNEWWLVGTDATSHWVPEGTSGVVGQADITNEFILMGVQGGLPLMFLFIAVLVMAFRAVGRALNRCQDAPLSVQLLIWTMGSVLFAHTVTFWSVAYFEPSLVLFFFVLVAALGSLDSAVAAAAAVPQSEDPPPSIPASGSLFSHG
ncbi:MAG: hypothetical protein SH819_11030 [Cytophagales bacterium]|nr:hypothetical protein [Cytophagales bacterium]